MEISSNPIIEGETAPPGWETMVIATVFARGRTISTRIIDVFTSSRGKIARLEALPVDGRQIEPFVRWTHGGWASYSTTTVPLSLLRNIALVLVPVAAQSVGPAE